MSKVLKMTRVTPRLYKCFGHINELDGRVVALVRRLLRFFSLFFFLLFLNHFEGPKNLDVGFRVYVTVSR